jgi:hypothetical protein
MRNIFIDIFKDSETFGFNCSQGRCSVTPTVLKSTIDEATKVQYET